VLLGIRVNTVVSIAAGLVIKGRVGSTAGFSIGSGCAPGPMFISGGVVGAEGIIMPPGGVPIKARPGSVLLGVWTGSGVTVTGGNESFAESPQGSLKEIGLSSAYAYRLHPSASSPSGSCCQNLPI